MVVDTNVLMRLVTGDVPHLAEQAATEIGRHRAGTIVVPDYILAELAFVLEFHKPYAWKRHQIVDAMKDIHTTPQFAVSRTAREAIKYYTEPKLDFPDCLLIAHAKLHNTGILSFDKDLQKTLGS